MEPTKITTDAERLGVGSILGLNTLPVFPALSSGKALINGLFEWFGEGAISPGESCGGSDTAL